MNTHLQPILSLSPHHLLSFLTQNQRLYLSHILLKTIPQLPLQQLIPDMISHQSLKQQTLSNYIQQHQFLLMIVIAWKICNKYTSVYLSQKKSSTIFIHQFTQKLKETSGLKVNEFETVKQFYEHLRSEANENGENEFISLLRNLPICEVNTSSDKKIEYNQLDCIIRVLIQNVVEFQLGQKKKRLKKQPWIRFQKLNPYRTKTITLFFSGFGSEKSCKATEWKGFLKSVEREAYAIRWESKSLQSILSFVNDHSVPSSSPTLAILGTLSNMLLNFDKNPFTQAVQLADITGQVVAQLLIDHFQGYTLNLVGFSLGTELICKLLTRLVAKNKANMVEKVVLMGGAVDHSQLVCVLDKCSHPLSIYNFYTEEDYALKYLLRAFKFNSYPIGLQKISEIRPHKVYNEDVSGYVEGHVDYRQKMDLICGSLRL